MQNTHVQQLYNIVLTNAIISCCAVKQVQHNNSAKVLKALVQVCTNCKYNCSCTTAYGVNYNINYNNCTA